MRVLMIVYNRVGKGTYWRALQFARVLAEHHQYEVTVMATAQSRRWGCKAISDVSGVTIIETPNVLGGPLSAGWDPLNLLARLGWSIQQSSRFDIVHAFECRPTVIFPALYWKNNRGSTFITDWCDWFGRDGAVAQRKNPLTRALLRPAETFFEEYFRTKAAGTTVINTLLRRFAVELGVAEETILDLPNGSDTHRLKPIPLTEARNVLGVIQDVPIVGYIGAAFEQDGKLMARAFNLIQAQVPNARLLLAGYCNVQVEQWLDRPEAVIRTGKISNQEVNLYLAASNLCWLPLSNSGANRGRFPLKIHDYIAVGRPVIGTDVGDLGEFIRTGQFGIAVPDNAVALADAAVTLLRDPETLEKLGKVARTFAETEATWARAGEKLLMFYRSVKGKRENSGKDT